MGIQHNFGNEPFWDWRRSVTKTLQIHDTDIMRIWRRLGQTPDPVGAPPAGSGPWTPAPGTSGGNGQVYEGILAGDLVNSTGGGLAAATATLNLYAVVSGSWTTNGTLTVTNRSDYLWLPGGYRLQVQNINGEYRPMIDFAPRFRGALTSTLPTSGTGTADLRYWNGTAWTAYSPAKSVTVLPGLPITSSIASGKSCWIEFQNGAFFVTQAGC